MQEIPMAVAKKKPASYSGKKTARTGSTATRKKSAASEAARPPATKASAPRSNTDAPATGAPSMSVGQGQLSYLGIPPYQEKKGEEYMSPRQVEHFRNILETWKSKLIEEMERTVHHMRDEAANFPDPNDRASQESDFALELRTRDRERKLIKKIEESLRNLDNSEYGYCEVCGIEIGIRRLEARPTATLCIDCKTLDEIRERQNKG
jgi:DnaK suppressor protein